MRDRRRLMERSIKKEQAPKVTISHAQLVTLSDLWMIYGNNGRLHSHANHKFIQGIIERGRDYREFYDASPECIAAVDRVLAQEQP